jgi:malate/lactate dehydrogenase
MDLLSKIYTEIAKERGIKTEFRKWAEYPDSAQACYRLSEAMGYSQNDINGMVIGGHGDKTMTTCPLVIMEWHFR